MDISTYLAQYLVTNDEKVIGNIPNFLTIAVGRVNKRLRSAFTETFSADPTLSADAVAIKFLTVNGVLYTPSLYARDGTYNVAAGQLLITPALVPTDVLSYCYYRVNQDVLTGGSPAVLIHGAAAEALMFEGNSEGAAAEVALFNQDLDECLGWEAHGGLAIGGLSGTSNVQPGSGSSTPSGPPLSNEIPLVESGTGLSGVSLEASRADHVHPEFAGAGGPPLSDALPQIEDGIGAAGTSTDCSRADHVHPAFGAGALSNSNPIMDGTASPGTLGNASRGDHRHPSDTSKAGVDGSGAFGTWGISISGTAGTEFTDSTFRIIGEVDPSKKVAFDVDGLTAATTRTITVPDASGTMVVNGGSSALVSGSYSGASGTTIAFTSIPSWVKRITLNFVAVSTNGTNPWLVQIGDSGGIEATGYVCCYGYIQQGFGSTVETATTGFAIASSSATVSFHGSITLTLADASTNRWCVSSSQLIHDGGATIGFTSGSKALSATLDKVYLTTVGGTDSFDAGNIGIVYE